MSDGWRFLAQRLDGEGAGTFLDLDVPLMDVQIEDVLTGDNSLQASITPEYARLKVDGRPLFTEWSTALWAEHGGVIRGGGILTNSGFSGADWSLECVGYTGYLADMPYTGGGQHFEKTDAADIFRAVWDHVQSQPGGDLGFEIDDYKSGVLVGDKLRQVEFDTESGPVSFEAGPYKLNRFSNHDLSDDAVELASIGRFDWREQHTWRSDSTIAHRLVLGRDLGSRRDDLRFVIGENVDVIPDVERDGEMYASDVLALGAGEGSAQKNAIARRNTGRLRRVAVVVDSSIRSVSGITQRAEREVAWRNDIDDINSIVVRNHPHASIGAVQAGDEIRVQGDLGWMELDTYVRVLSRTINVDDGDSMTLSVARTSRVAA